MTALPGEIPAPIVLPQQESAEPAVGDSYYSDSDLYVWDGDDWVLGTEDPPEAASYNATTGVWTIQ